MFSNRLLYVILVFALLLVAGLTVQGVAATANLVSDESVCRGVASQTTFHTKYVAERGAWVTYTEDGPTGVDGGLIYLLSENRCAE